MAMDGKTSVAKIAAEYNLPGLPAEVNIGAAPSAPPYKSQAAGSWPTSGKDTRPPVMGIMTSWGAGKG